MFQVLAADSGAEPEGGESDCHPGQLVGDSDNAGMASVLRYLGGGGVDDDSLVQPRPQLSGTNVTCAKAKATDHRCAENGDPRGFIPV